MKLQIGNYLKAITNSIMYVQNNKRKTKMLDSNKRQPLNCRLLSWDKQIENVVELN